MNTHFFGKLTTHALAVLKRAVSAIFSKAKTHAMVFAVVHSPNLKPWKD